MDMNCPSFIASLGVAVTNKRFSINDFSVSVMFLLSSNKRWLSVAIRPQVSIKCASSQITRLI